MKKEIFSEKLIRWYHLHKRDLPWRVTQNPYFIWLSEIILQQTRVAQGLPYYQKFVNQYPDIQSFATADERDILRLWQGLGYYSRARNMHATAKLINENLDGKFPTSYAELIKLKGIGPYTAAAIASFASGEKVAVLDGNVFRVLARIFGETTDISSHQAKKVFGELANSLLPNEDSATHNQAIMELGAIQCTPANPNCLFCPFSLDCVANATGQQANLPVKNKTIKVRERFFNYLVIEQDGKLLMQQRDKKDIWAGLCDFYLIEDAQQLLELDEMKDKLLSMSSAEEITVETIMQEATIHRISEAFTHVLTHQRIQVKFWHLVLKTAVKIPFPPNFSFYSLVEAEELPKPILVHNYLKKYFF